MKSTQITTLLVCFLFALNSNAQKAAALITGKVCDQNGSPLINATISLTKADENTKSIYAVSDDKGVFSINLPKIGNYSVLVSYIGYSNFNKNVFVAQPTVNMGVIPLKELAVGLSEVKAVGRAIRSIHKGDTLQYNAEAFKAIKGANAEDLIAKMPGIVVNNSNVKAQGEEVKKVLLDGKQFFEGDVTTALRNIPSEIVSSIQVFDKKSEQAQFTGFDDGQSTKTINVVTNRKSQQSYLGKFLAGTGTDNRYQLSGTLNIFNGDRRITFLGMCNNINQQNFSQEDIIGIMSKKSSGGSGMMPPPPGGGITDNLIGQMGGISKTNALGLNYSDNWGKKIDVSGSYFFNSTDNNTEKSTNRIYFDETQGKKTYTETSSSLSKTYNHRFNMKLDYTIDEHNSITFIPRVSLQKSNYISTQTATLFNNGATTNSTSSATVGDGTGYNLNGLMLYRHKFEKTGRTISLGLNGGASDNEKSYLYDATNGIAGNLTLLRQKVNNFSSGYNWGSNLMYTEPIRKNIQMMANYSVNYQYSNADKKSFDYNATTQAYSALNDSLSNIYTSNYLTQRGGAGLRIVSKKLNLMAGVNYQLATLKGNQEYPITRHTSKNFSSILPMAMADITLNKYNAMRIGLFSMSSAPSVSQLQNVVDNSNTLMLSSGNPNLKEQISNSLNVRYTHSSITGETFIAMLNLSNKLHYIGDSVQVVQSGNTSQQFTKPVNLDGFWSASSMLTYGFPVDLFRSNLNLSADLNYSRLPAIYNGVKQITQNYAIAPTAVMSSNISNRLDFTLNYSAKMNFAKSINNAGSNSSYFVQTGGAKLDWIIYHGFTLGSNLSWQNYSGLSSGYNENYYLLNASLGKKFLKNQSAEIKLQAYDVLQQQQNINRNINANYYEDVSNNILKPYWMMTFTFDLRSFKS